MIKFFSIKIERTMYVGETSVIVSVHLHNVHGFYCAVREIHSLDFLL